MIDCFKKIFSKNKMDNYQVVVSESILAEDKTAWDSINHNLYLSYEFLKVYEQIFQSALSFRYVLVYKDKVPVFKTYFQIKDFQASELGEMLDSEIVDIRKKRYKLLAKLFKQYSEKNLIRVITCGNNIITGEHAFAFDRTLINKQQVFDILIKVIEGIEESTNSKKRICGILAKDFYNETVQDIPHEEGYIPFQVEPEMRVDLVNVGKTVDDYIQLFAKKYRNRAKIILSKRTGIIEKEFTKADIKTHESAIESLYKEVVDKADFNLLTLPENYFYEMKSNLSSHFNFYGYFKDDELIAFRTSIQKDKNTIEAHFIGLKYELNKSLELYQNILYYYIEEGLRKNCSTLLLGRTASEIKTTVGAIAVELNCFVKPSNKISGLIVQPYLKYLQPTPFQARHPFKELDNVDV
jgi:hypothetical protein